MISLKFYRVCVAQSDSEAAVNSCGPVEEREEESLRLEMETQQVLSSLLHLFDESLRGLFTDSLI